MSDASSIDPFAPPRGGMGSQAGDPVPVSSAFWQPPEAVQESDFYRYREGSVFLGWSGEHPIGVADDRHIGVVAGARAGKTSTLLIPNLHLYPGSIVVMDPKGELATATAEHRADRLGHKVHVLDPWGVADVRDELRGYFDPLDELREADPKAMLDRVDDASLIAEALLQEQGENNAHWTNSARDFLRAVILWVAHDDAMGGFAHLPALMSEFMAVGEKTEPADNLFAHMLSFGSADGPAPRDVRDVIANAADGMMGTQSRERASILSTARNQLGFLESGPMRASLARSTLKLRDLKRGVDGRPVTIYLCLPASRMGTHAKWLRLFLNLAMAALEREPARPGALPVLLMLEEFAALGHMRALEQASAYMAGFGVKLMFVLQDLTQLKRHYAEGWETFLGNSGTVIAFGNADQTTLDYISKRLGSAAVYLVENRNRNEHDARSGQDMTRRDFKHVSLMSPDELALDFGRHTGIALVMVAGAPPITLERYRIDAERFGALLRKDNDDR